MTSSPQHEQGYARAVKDCVEWLHHEARQMNDGRAKSILDGAAFGLGTTFRRVGRVSIRLNCDPDNWVAVPRALLPRLSGKSGRDYDHAPDEIKPTIMAIARLEHAARDAKTGKRSRADRVEAEHG